MQFTYLTTLFLVFGCLQATLVEDELCIVTEFEQVENATKTCTNIVLQGLTIPGGVTLKLNLIQGTTVKFSGSTYFEHADWLGPLVTINGTGIHIQGDSSSVIYGQGEQYWDGLGGNGSPKPQFFTIEAFDSVFSNLSVVNSPKDVIQITNSNNVTFYNWRIDDVLGNKGVASEGHEGHHTDGIDVWNSTNVLIYNVWVWNQDDCLAIRCGANITVYDLHCYGSHGLSISVGFSADDISVNTLTNVTIKDSYLEGGQNGIHIKTHNDGGPGLISNVTYSNITLNGPEHFGVQIQQNYPRGEVVGNVPINNLNFEDIKGVVADTAIPVFILCADGACNNWSWDKVQINGTQLNECNFEPEGYNC